MFNCIPQVLSLQVVTHSQMGRQTYGYLQSPNHCIARPHTTAWQHQQINQQQAQSLASIA